MRRLGLLLALLLLATPAFAQNTVTTNANITGVLPTSSFPVGSGTATATVQGTLTTSTAAVCTIADLVETDLWTYTLPANTLDANGRGVRVSVLATAAANANTKTIKLYVAGVNVMNSGVLTAAPNGIDYIATFTVLRTGAATEIGFGLHGLGTTFQAKSNLSMAGDTTAGIIIKITGQNGVATANDICARGAAVETVK